VTGFDLLAYYRREAELSDDPDGVYAYRIAGLEAEAAGPARKAARARRPVIRIRRIRKEGRS